jgi:hypothetical protein
MAADFGKTALLAFASLLLALTAGELVVQLWMPMDDTAYVLDERYIYKFAPNKAVLTGRSAWTRSEGTLRIQSNSFGYRGPEPDHGPGRRRIVVYGDSFIHAKFSPLENTFVQKMEDELRGRGDAGVQVLNAGVAGYGPDQSSLRIEDEVDALDPDLLILAVYTGNDFGDLLRNKIYRFEDGSLVENDYVIHPKTRALFEEKKRLFAGEGFAGRSRLVQAAKRLYFDRRQANAREAEDPPMRLDDEAVLRLVNAKEREYRRFVLQGDHRVRIRDDSADFDVSLLPHSDSARYKLALMEAVLARIGRSLDARGVPLVLLIIPTSIDTCEGVAQFDPSAFPDYRPSGPSNALVEMAERAGTPHLDLFPVFRGADCEALYFPQPDGHWNDRGQALAARRMADLLVADSLWDTTRSP